jgi:hypothetical protein
MVHGAWCMVLVCLAEYKPSTRMDVRGGTLMDHTVIIMLEAHGSFFFLTKPALPVLAGDYTRRRSIADGSQ